MPEEQRSLGNPPPTTPFGLGWGRTEQRAVPAVLHAGWEESLSVPEAGRRRSSASTAVTSMGRCGSHVGHLLHPHINHTSPGHSHEEMWTDANHLGNLGHIHAHLHSDGHKGGPSGRDCVPSIYIHPPSDPPVLFLDLECGHQGNPS